MKEVGLSESREAIATLTFVLIENRDGVRTCEVSSAVDEAKLTPSDAAKMQHKLIGWHTYFLAVFLRKIESHLDRHECAIKDLAARAPQQQSLHIERSDES